MATLPRPKVYRVSAEWRTERRLNRILDEMDREREAERPVRKRLRSAELEAITIRRFVE